MASCTLSSSHSCFGSSSRRLAVQHCQQRQPATPATRGTCMLVHAAAKPPAGVTLPPVKPEVPPPSFGFVDNAERINSRAAMIGFFGLLLVEAILNQGILDFLGIGTGRGL